MHFACATPRHAGVHFERSGQSVASNIVLSASELAPSEYRPEATSQAPSIAAIGTIAFVACESK